MPRGVYKRTKEQLLKIGLSKIGNTNGFKKGCIPYNFKGNNARYETKHQWIYYHFGKANKCENKNCKYKNPKRFHWANISGDYKRDISDWIQLCPSCHKKIDWKPSPICRNGHILENVGFLIDNRGSRVCKMCKKKNAQKYYLKHKYEIIKRITERRRLIRSTIKRY